MLTRARPVRPIATTLPRPVVRAHLGRAARTGSRPETRPSCLARLGRLERAHGPRTRAPPFLALRRFSLGDTKPDALLLFVRQPQSPPVPPADGCRVSTAKLGAAQS